MILAIFDRFSDLDISLKCDCWIDYLTRKQCCQDRKEFWLSVLNCEHDCEAVGLGCEQYHKSVGPVDPQQSLSSRFSGWILRSSLLKPLFFPSLRPF